jgi:hypothetical protein
MINMKLRDMPLTLKSEQYLRFGERGPLEAGPKRQKLKQWKRRWPQLQTETRTSTAPFRRLDFHAMAMRFVGRRMSSQARILKLDTVFVTHVVEQGR